MDSLFDDDIDEVGSEIEAYCPGPRCKADTTHTIISMYENEIRRVQCSVCNDVHAYRKPRGETFDDTVELIPMPQSRQLSWEESMSHVSEKALAQCRPYSIRDTYETMDVVSHPTFGIGFVTELLPDNKVEITFKDERRVLVHNRADLAEKMPSIAEMPAPRQKKKKRRRKKSSAKAVDVEVAATVAAPDQEALAQAEVARQHAAEKAQAVKRAHETQHVAQKLIAERVALAGGPAKAARGAAKIAKVAPKVVAKAPAKTAITRVGAKKTAILAPVPSKSAAAKVATGRGQKGGAKKAAVKAPGHPRRPRVIPGETAASASAKKTAARKTTAKKTPARKPATTKKAVAKSAATRATAKKGAAKAPGHPRRGEKATAKKAAAKKPASASKKPVKRAASKAPKKSAKKRRTA